VKTYYVMCAHQSYPGTQLRRLSLEPSMNTMYSQFVWVPYFRGVPHVRF